MAFAKGIFMQVRALCSGGEKSLMRSLLGLIPSLLGRYVSTNQKKVTQMAVDKVLLY